MSLIRRSSNVLSRVALLLKFSHDFQTLKSLHNLSGFSVKEIQAHGVRKGNRT